MSEPPPGVQPRRQAGPDEIADAEVVTLTSDLIRIDTTNRGGGDGRERPAAEYVAGRLSEASLEPVLLESAPGRANVVARIAGTDPGAAALLVHGHRDAPPGRSTRSPARCGTAWCGGAAPST